jgi:Flp pilus assembly protein TadD
MRGAIIFLGWMPFLCAQDDFARAERLYQRTDYQASIAVLHSASAHSAASHGLAGKNWFMLGEYKKATAAFHQALELEPSNSEYALWLGRGYGRRAETSSPLTAPLYAAKARQYFEEAVRLDPSNGEALNDLFDYYLEAPGFLGGGFDKAERIALCIAERNPAEGHFSQAQLADRRKQFDTAEEQLRRAMELAPLQVGRVLDLAKYLARRGRYRESDAAFDKAEQIAPAAPKVYFARASALIEQKRNLPRARQLLIQYLQSDLTPDDPPREQAERLLKQVAGS